MNQARMLCSDSIFISVELKETKPSLTVLCKSHHLYFYTTFIRSKRDVRYFLPECHSQKQISDVVYGRVLEPRARATSTNLSLIILSVQ
jgi:hypothetical protein